MSLPQIPLPAESVAAPFGNNINFMDQQLQQQQQAALYVQQQQQQQLQLQQQQHRPQLPQQQAILPPFMSAAQFPPGEDLQTLAAKRIRKQTH